MRAGPAGPAHKGSVPARICPVRVLPVHPRPARERRRPYRRPRRLRTAHPSPVRADSPLPSTHHGRQNPPRLRRQHDPFLMCRATPPRPRGRPHGPARRRRLVAGLVADDRRRRGGDRSRAGCRPGRVLVGRTGAGGFRRRARGRGRHDHPTARLPSHRRAPPGATSGAISKATPCRAERMTGVRRNHFIRDCPIGDALPLDGGSHRPSTEHDGRAARLLRRE